ncbi:WD40/YVTN/BNR-like repeat-containing protein [Deinococcus cellulosilyticus]|uniref:Xyloglucanase n=1 Tax=Deinococcus cellulosilyticus (strain DSM 18568 / NBRC 106333 / KACC 11606 / 5516J-15) TaxID=1223518 RepID=A0A511N4C8_DEIC1|nr:sialidase family protein [Deinococcus cellulosilyticus]GEM47231.1 xyloglucanase [Deinococcus cellulosilyticus NBRC 106333 = KACC 11606]
MLKLTRSVRFSLIALSLLTGTVGCANLTVPPAKVTTQAYNWRNVEIVGGGYVPGIIFNQSEKDLIYARTDIGGAYRWDKASGRWIQLLNWVGADNWGLSGVDSLATDPVDPNRVYLAVGTYTNDWDPNNGAILRSSDRGDTWQKTDLPFKMGGNMPGRGMGERLSIDPNKNSILYLGARSGNGLWRSTDYGVTWSKVDSFPVTGDYIPEPGNPYSGDKIGVVWITFDKSSSTAGNATKTLYVGVADKAHPLYQSKDGGATWQEVPGQPTGFLPHHGELDSEGNLYITYSDGAGPYDGEKGDVWKLNTRTGEWTNINPFPATVTDKNWGYGGLALDRQKPGTLMVAALNAWWPDTILFRSTDYGKTWTRIWDWGNYPERTFRYNMDSSGAPWLNFGATVPKDPEPMVKVGWMVDDLEIDPFDSNRMMYGTGATVFGSTNLTEWDKGNKIDLKVMAQGIEETAVLDLISPPKGANLYSALGDIAGFKHDDLTKVPQKMIANPLPGSNTSLDYAEKNPDLMVRVGNGGAFFAYSADGGETWTNGKTTPAGTNGGGNLALSAEGKTVLWSPGGAKVSYSTNNGDTWTASAGLPEGSATVVSDRENDQRFYAFSKGELYVSIDGGKTFTIPEAQNLPHGLGTRKDESVYIQTVPGQEKDLWIAAGKRGLFHSTDGGASFKKLDLVDTANVIGFGKAAPGKDDMAIYITGAVDGKQGFYRSDDGGQTWVHINDAQHQFGSTNSAITGDPRVYGRVYIGTNGYGIVYGDIK